MKKKLTGIVLLLLFFAMPLQGQAKVKAPKKQCHAYAVMDAGSGEVLDKKLTKRFIRQVPLSL